MTIKIQAFGVLEEITQTHFELEADDLNMLKQQLFVQFPELKNYTYLIAVNKNIVQENISLNASDEVAILPPFSGG